MIAIFLSHLSLKISSTWQDSGGEAIGILEKGGKTTIIAPELEAQRAKEDSVDCNIITSPRGYPASTLSGIVKKKKICTDCQNYTTMQSLKKSIPKIKQSSIPFTMHD